MTNPNQASSAERTYPKAEFLEFSDGARAFGYGTPGDTVMLNLGGGFFPREDGFAVIGNPNMAIITLDNEDGTMTRVGLGNGVMMTRSVDADGNRLPGGIARKIADQHGRIEIIVGKPCDWLTRHAEGKVKNIMIEGSHWIDSRMVGSKLDQPSPFTGLREKLEDYSARFYY